MMSEVQGSSKSVKENGKRAGLKPPSSTHYSEESYEILHTQAKSRDDCDQSNTNSACYPQISIVPRRFTLMYAETNTTL